MAWADEYRKLGVRTNADTPHDAEVAREFGAEGIGLCRTEHMFFEGDRIDAVREMILADTLEERRAALAKVEPLSAGGLRRHLPGDGRPAGDDPHARPAAARVPAARATRRSTSWPSKMGIASEQLQAQGREPARGQPDARLPRLPPRHRLSRDHRDAGARDLQGGRRVRRSEGIDVMPEVMIPLVGDVNELRAPGRRSSGAWRRVMSRPAVRSSTWSAR